MDNKTQRIFCRVTPEEKARVDRVSDAMGKTPSQIIRATFDRLAREHGVYEESK